MLNNNLMNKCQQNYIRSYRDCGIPSFIPQFDSFLYIKSGLADKDFFCAHPQYLNITSNVVMTSPVTTMSPFFLYYGHCWLIPQELVYKGCRKKNLCFKLYNFCLRLLKENDIYLFWLLRIWKFLRSNFYPGFYSSLNDKK